MPFTEATLAAVIELLDGSPADCSDGIIPAPASFMILAPGGGALLTSDQLVLACADNGIDLAPLREAIDRLAKRRRNIPQPADPFAGGIDARIRFVIAVTRARFPIALRLVRNQPLDFVAQPGQRYQLPRICRFCMSQPAEYDCPDCQTAGTIELGAPADPDAKIQLPQLCPHGTFDRGTCPPCLRAAAIASAGGTVPPVRVGG